MQIERADQTHLEEIARLFDLYRQFYECEPDLSLAKNFIGDRLEKEESIIFVASTGTKLHGFVQLYPSFCSVEAIKIFILYDLYVEKSARNTGIGTLLMNEASDFAANGGASRVDLLTAISNKAGQHLYEKLGYKRMLENFHAYSLYL